MSQMQQSIDQLLQFLQQQSMQKGAGISAKDFQQIQSILAPERAAAKMQSAAALTHRLKVDQFNTRLANSDWVIKRYGYRGPEHPEIKAVLNEIKKIDIPQSDDAVRRIQAKTLGMHEKAVNRMVASESVQFRKNQLEPDAGFRQTVSDYIKTGTTGDPDAPTINEFTAKSVNEKVEARMAMEREADIRARLSREGIIKTEDALARVSAATKGATQKGFSGAAGRAVAKEASSQRMGSLAKKGGIGLAILGALGLAGKEMFGKKGESGLPPQVQMMLMEQMKGAQIDPALQKGRELRNQMTMLQIAKMLADLQGTQNQQPQRMI